MSIATATQAADETGATTVDAASVPQSLLREPPVHLRAVAPVASPATAAVAPTPAPASEAAASAVPVKVSIDVRAERITTVIAAGMKFSGTIEGSDGIIVRGVFEGDILIEDGEDPAVGTVIVEEGGEVRGTISGKRVIVLGSAQNVISRTSLIVGEKGCIEKATYYNRCTMADGGVIEGTIKRIRGDMDPLQEIRQRTGI